jgi:hypothetical protein
MEPLYSFCSYQLCKALYQYSFQSSSYDNFLLDFYEMKPWVQILLGISPERPEIPILQDHYNTKIVILINRTQETFYKLSSIKTELQAAIASLMLSLSEICDFNTHNPYNIPAHTKLRRNSKEFQLKIFILNLTGKTISIHSKYNDSIRDIKSQIYDKEGIPINHQILIYSRQPLEDSKSLAYYHIHNESTVYLMQNLRGGMQIFIETLLGNQITIDFELSDTIHNIKARIQDKEGIPIELQRLIYKRQVLEDNKTLADYNISKEDTIYLIRRVRSTMQIFIQTFTGKTILIDCEEYDTVEVIKSKILAKEGVDIKKQMLFLNEKQLEDGRSLTQCDIKRDSTILLEIRTAHRRKLCIIQ